MTGGVAEMRSVVVATVIGVVALAAPAVAAQESLYEAGNQRYQAGDYAAAVESWLRITEAGYESGELYYNLGNGYFKLGELGRAILYYERAARLIPGDENLRANLELARSMTADEIVPLPGFWLLRAWRWVVDLFPVGLLAILAACCYLAACTVAVMLILRAPLPRVVLIRSAAAATGLLLVFGGLLLTRELGVGRPQEAVILASEVQVRSAPADEPDLLLFSIHEGTVVRVDRRAEEWAEIVLADGKVGWVPTDVLETI